MSEQKESQSKQSTSYKAVSRRPQLKANKYTTAVILLLLGCFTVGLGGGFVGAHFSTMSLQDRSTAADGNTIISAEEEDISAVASKVGPSVVSILTEERKRTYFGDRLQTDAGTGIIITSDGYILTNKHVVAGNGKLSIVTSDGTVYDDVRVLGSDPLNDLAFLKLDGVKDLTPAALGDSSSVRIGQKVVAIGNSLGEYRNTVTSGIISGTGRPVSAQDGNSIANLTDLLQTDAAINPGNSGGPLVNLSGQVIGINTAVAADAQSIGFAIPINSTKGIIKHLMNTGEVKRAYVGINYISITPEVAKQYNLPVKKGAYITSDRDSGVIIGSPADKAGLLDKDIILKVGDAEVGEKGSVSSLISEYTIGDKVELTVLRGDKEMTVTVTLEAYKEPTNN